MMSKPMVLVFLLVILIITSQFEWKQQFVIDLDRSPSISQKHDDASKREEVVKEKIILSQEKNIQRLNDLVHSLERQLEQCRMSNNIMNQVGSSLSSKVVELEQQQFLDGAV